MRKKLTILKKINVCMLTEVQKKVNALKFLG